MHIEDISGPHQRIGCHSCQSDGHPAFLLSVSAEPQGGPPYLQMKLCMACFGRLMVPRARQAGYIFADRPMRERAPDDVSSEWREIVAALQLDRTPPRDEILAMLVHGRESVPLAVRAYLNGLFTGLRG